MAQTDMGEAQDERDQRGPRKQSREARRSQLIEATLETLAARGYARVTLLEVARTAGLSHGLVNFHFSSKEKLLEATLTQLAEEYRANWLRHVEEAGEDPAAQLAAMVAADFDPVINSPLRIAAWCAFLGEAQVRPLYQAQCQANDEAYVDRMEVIVRQLLNRNGMTGHACRIARAIRLVSLGSWVDVVTLTAPYTMAEARETAFTAARAFFPDEPALQTA
ncbi:TetR family transcriptional regulator [Stagnihabitans tardus]|uniref:TetR family transcriptional regulator n=1 Tax=Stagnihabitans tardus TaxID=2699202 RepID=A0AAE5BW41_9RHOB|nr:TetR family transcriptional regulator [Stagnihabitans tardus]NBZ87933.1 TetR family transcriptional regulator [Stagnihabitans tardus]